MKKKVAVQISGYLRTINECLDSWRNILDYDKYDYEFFIHTYRNYGFSKGFCFSDIVEDDLVSIEDIKSRLNIKEIYSEEQFKHADDFIISGHNRDRVKLMFRKIYLCNQMYREYCLSNNENYEFVIRMRPDIFFDKKIQIDIPKQNTIYVSKFAWGNDIVSGRLNDQFVICSNDTIDKYCGLFMEYASYSNIQPEKALFEYINSKEIKVEYFDFGFEIKR